MVGELNGKSGLGAKINWGGGGGGMGSQLQTENIIIIDVFYHTIFVKCITFIVLDTI